MRSSTSTGNRSADPAIRLLLLEAHEDNPRACTGRRLVHHGRVHALGSRTPPRPSPILLDPRAVEALSRGDLSHAEAGGILVVDCSWNQLNARGGFPAGARWLASLPLRRRLPMLIAGNPQHYGRLGELSTAEAFAAALVVLGETKAARGLLGEFRGGDAFFQLNDALLREYARARTSAQITEAESTFF